MKLVLIKYIRAEKMLGLHGGGFRGYLLEVKGGKMDTRLPPTTQVEKRERCIKKNGMTVKMKALYEGRVWHRVEQSGSTSAAAPSRREDEAGFESSDDDEEEEEDLYVYWTQ